MTQAVDPGPTRAPESSGSTTSASRTPTPWEPPPPRPLSLEPAAPAPVRGVGAWLIGPLLLSASVAAMLLIMRGPDQLFLWAVGTMFVLALTWMLVSVFFPASVDRTCPSCGARTLRRMDPKTTRGLTCTSCGHTDATASSFLMAEAEGPLEEAVLNERRLRKTRRSPGREEPVA